MIPKRIVVVAAFPLNQNGKIDRAGLGKRPPHDLHESRDAAELSARLERLDVDLLSLVSEFVKPAAELGLLAERMTTGSSDLALLVLVNDRSALKQRKREVSGNVIEYLPTAGSYDSRLSLVVHGIKINLDFVTGPAVDSSVLERLAGGWIVHGHEVVKRVAAGLAGKVG